jgi:hypothetical protein
MAKRATNKEKIQQLAEEAAVGEEKKVVKKRKTTTRKKATATSSRKKIVWKVFDSSFNEVASFPYPEKDNAYSKAEDLTRIKKKNYFVNDISVPMEEE